MYKTYKQPISSLKGLLNEWQTETTSNAFEDHTLWKVCDAKTTSASYGIPVNPVKIHVDYQSGKTCVYINTIDDNTYYAVLNITNHHTVQQIRDFVDSEYLLSGNNLMEFVKSLGGSII